VFLPTSTHPDRDEAWRDHEADNYETDEDFLAEHPETSDEALIGAGKDRYFALSDVSAAVQIGADFDSMLGTDDMPPPAGEFVHLGIDWGEATAAYLIWPLEAGGVYVPPFESEGGLPLTKTEPADAAAVIHAAALELQDVDEKTGRLRPAIEEARYDAAGIQSMRTFLATARARHTQQYNHGDVRSRKVPFADYKTETAKYLRRLFRRAGRGQAVGVIAISPANKTLIRQLRALESGPGGVWKKQEDQHGPDAVVAGVQRIARTNRALRGE
jgi:hypothetical protein